MSHRPPKNDRERLENLIEALSMPDDDGEDDALDEEIHAELASRGLTLETWAAQIRAQAQAVLDRNRRARRMRVIKMVTVGAVGLAAVAGVVLALRSTRDPPGNAGAPRWKNPPPLSLPDAGRDAGTRR